MTALVVLGRRPDFVAKAKPDGYNDPGRDDQLACNQPERLSEVPYDAVKSFEPVI
jgi:hypothetical protein